MSIGTILVYYLTIVFSTFIMLKIYEKYSEKRLEIDKKNIFGVLFISFCVFLNNLFNITVLRTIISPLLSFFLFKLIFKDSNKITIYYTIVMTIILYIVDLITALLLPLGINNIEMLNHSLTFKVIISIMVNLIFYFIMTNKLIINFIKNIRSITKNKYFMYILLLISLLIVNVLLLYSGFNTSDKILNIILCVIEILIFLFIIILIKNQYDKNISKIKEEQLKQNLDLYAKVAQEYRELKHNLMNDLLIIKTKVKKNDQEFINDIINKYRSNYEWVNCITDIPEGIQGLIFLKKNQAELYNITFNIEYNIDKNVENIFAINKNFKLYEALGILFDNAIEAAKESKEKVINVVFSMENNEMHINILNTYNNSIDLNKIGNKDYSTKQRGSGIGLNYIKNHRNKFKVTQSIRDNIFITDITLNSKEKK